MAYQANVCCALCGGWATSPARPKPKRVKSPAGRTFDTCLDCWRDYREGLI